jgi:hypothetical protein
MKVFDETIFSNGKFLPILVWTLLATAWIRIRFQQNALTGFTDFGSKHWTFYGFDSPF